MSHTDLNPEIFLDLAPDPLKIFRTRIRQNDLSTVYNTRQMPSNFINDDLILDVAG